MSGVATVTGMIDVSGPEFVITFPFDPALKDAVKTLPRRKWNPNPNGRGGDWRAPVCAANNQRILQLVEHGMFRLTQTAREALNSGGPRHSLAYEGGERMFVHKPRTPETIEAIEPLFGTYSKTHHGWNVALAPHAIVGLRRLVDAGYLKPSPAAADELAARLPDAIAYLEKYRELGARSKEAAASLEIDGLGGELREYQRAGVAYAVETRRCMIADEMGLGKTITALATAQAENAYPVVVVSPAIVKFNWEREARKWLPGKRIEVISGTRTPDTLPMVVPDVFVINYDILHAWAGWLAECGPKTLIADESHYAKNPTARRTQALHDLSRRIPRDGLVLLLTGTPVLNRPSELISQLDIMGRLGDLGGKRYLQTRYTEWDGSARNEIELHRRLRATCYVRRDKSEVLTELPEKQRATVLLDVKMGKAYAEVKREVVDWLRAHENDARTTDSTRRTQLDKIKKEITADKMGVAIEWIREFLGSGKKLVVFAYHRQYQYQLVKEFPDAARVLGDTWGTLSLEEKAQRPRGDSKPPEGWARERMVDRFQTDPDCQLIICSLKAAGVGITLTAASDVVFVEMGWTPADQDQAEDRCHRLGQHDGVTAWYLLARGTEDVEVADLIDAKRQVVTAVTDGREVEADESIVTALTRRLLQEGAK